MSDKYLELIKNAFDKYLTILNNLSKLTRISIIVGGILLIAIYVLFFQGGLSGTYIGTARVGYGQFQRDMNVGSMKFETNGDVYITAMGMTIKGEYEIDGDKIIVGARGGNMVYTLNGDKIEGPAGIVYRKQ